MLSAPRCTLTTQTPQQDEHEYFETALDLHERFDIEEALGAHGIVPSEKATYAAADVLDALYQAFGYATQLHCDEEGRLVEVWMCFDTDLQAIDCSKERSGSPGTAVASAVHSRRALALSAAAQLPRRLVQPDGGVAAAARGGGRAAVRPRGQANSCSRISLPPTRPLPPPSQQQPAPGQAAFKRHAACQRFGSWLRQRLAALVASFKNVLL